MIEPHSPWIGARPLITQAIIATRGRTVNDCNSPLLLTFWSFCALAMKLGFNSNVDVAGAVYHVQTEDRGLEHPFVDTIVLSGGRVVHRRSASYKDLFSGGPPSQSALCERVEQQHREVMEGLCRGLLPLDESCPSGMALRLCNPRSWLAGGQASLDVEVSSPSGEGAVSGVEVVVSVESGKGIEVLRLAAQTGSDGHAHLSFRMPSLTGRQNPALVIGLAGSAAGPRLRYHLKPKMKPKTSGSSVSAQ